MQRLVTAMRSGWRMMAESVGLLGLQLRMVRFRTMSPEEMVNITQRLRQDADWGQVGRRLEQLPKSIEAVAADSELDKRINQWPVLTDRAALITLIRYERRYWHGAGNNNSALRQEGAGQ